MKSLSDGSSDLSECELVFVEVGICEEAIGQQNEDDENNDGDEELDGESRQLFEAIFWGAEDEDDKSVEYSIEDWEAHCECHEGEDS